MATADEDLQQIEKDIRRLKIEYEQYFGGGRPRPPADTQWRLETMMRRYNDRSAELTFAQRFRFNNLAQTYAKYVEMWRKKTQQKETGFAQHHYGVGATAKAIEDARNRATSGDPESAPSAAVAEYSRGAQLEDRREAFATSLADPEAEREKVTELYERLVAAHTVSGESSEVPSLSAFQRFVAKKTKELKDKGGNEVEYSVSVEAGRVRLKARISD